MPERKGERESKEAAKRRVEYNLEKEPLQTGRAESGIDLRTRVAMGDAPHTARRRMGGWMYVILIGLILLLGSVVVFLMRDVINALYYSEVG